VSGGGVPASGVVVLSVIVAILHWRAPRAARNSLAIGSGIRAPVLSASLRPVKEAPKHLMNRPRPSRPTGSPSGDSIGS
jgi:hypothetical protein